MPRIAFVDRIDAERVLWDLQSQRVCIMRTDWCNAAMPTERKPERGEGWLGENVWARRNDATKKHAMRAERERGGQD